jgi:putative ABC transport system permease protein
MFRSFLLITFRILWRNKVTSFVNIFSLSVGITAFIFIMLYVQYETSYDKFNVNYDRIYRLEGDGFGRLPPMVGAHVKDRLPEVENVARLAGNWKGNHSLSYLPENRPEDLKHIEASYFWADSTTFDVFTFPLIQGDPHTALKLPMTAVLTESTAKKLFGDSNPMMKTVEFSEHQFMVTGIIRDVEKSHIEIDVLFSLESISKIYPERDLNKTGPNSWLWSATYLLMTGTIDEKQVEDKINTALSEINNGSLFDTEFKHFHIRPMEDLYLDGVVQTLAYGLHGNLKMIHVLVAIGIFMLVLAGINYVNLTTARSAVRAKEIAVKRVSGSSANQLRYQLIVESIIVSLISLVVSVTIMQLSLSEFNQLTMVHIRVEELNRPEVWTGILASGVLIGILAGVYPAFYLTATQPVRLIKGEGIKGSSGALFRSGLMTFQFALSIVMIIAIIVNFRQLHYVRSADLGFTADQIITLWTPADFPDQFTLRATFKERLLQHSGIEKVTYSYGNPGDHVPDSPMLEINGTNKSVKVILIDEDYLDVMGITLAQGRGFSLDSPGDRWNPATRISGALINESMVSEFGMDSPVGKRIYYKGDNGYALEIIGVVNDFHLHSLHDKIEPLILMRVDHGAHASIKVASTDIPGTLKSIEAEWKKVFGLRPFVYQFLDETFDRQYKSDEQLATVIGYFTGLAVIIACLGLFALSSFMVSRRTKEIGIRKSMGASVGTIYSMLSWDFLRWILVAVLIASPVAWYLMRLWLETFAYHITLEADIFIIAALLAVAIALLTITAQALKAANVNPVESLRYE